MPKVLHIIDSFNMGGAETWILELVRYAARSRSQQMAFDFVAARGEKGLFDEEVISHGCRIYYLKLDKSHPVSFVKGLREILREGGYCAIHDHQDYLSGWHFLFGAGLLPDCRIAHVHNPHYQLYNNYGVNLRRRMNLWVGRLLLKRFSTHILGTSGRLLREYGMTQDAYPSQKVRPLYCAFDISRYRGMHADAKTEVCEEFDWDPRGVRIVLFAGRMDVSIDLEHPNNHKNSRFAVEVLKALDDPTVYLLMAGANDYVHDAFSRLLDQYGLQGRVRMLGIRRDLPKLMLAADALLFPSRSEGMGMVAVEAQAAGLPVVASDQVPAEIVVLEELVSFMSLNSPFDEWAGALRAMMDRRGESDTTGDVRWKSSPFNVEVCFDRLAECYVHCH